jgi:hypothetical protein
MTVTIEASSAFVTFEAGESTLTASFGFLQEIQRQRGRLTMEQ